ncbi:hypothetical protein [Paenarthrobacter sp. PH39-S1]|uniref:hypothetical protein n=1 Tax=Paenarthrobacter sp. PH39-S1 TaxID=3046204 RepID=UPI0024BBBBA0|nr:hypothetical protein [Paenarthrobacter sp. PH39-S1]MDJ0356058.1 hypothetical protein [Paenarthrobacter sp. PH39-S1]
MNNQQMQEISDRVYAALEGLSPHDPWLWTYVTALASVAVLTTAIVVTVVGLRNLRHQESASQPTVSSDARNLRRMRDSDAMTEWWRRAQWALSATASTNDTMYSYGIGILAVLAKSDLPGSEEKSLFDTVWEQSCTKMRDQEIRYLLDQHRDASQQEKGGPLIGHSSNRELSRPGTVNDPPVSGENGSSEYGLHGYPRADNPTRKEQVFAMLRREILAARLKVTLDEQLDRETSPTVKALAQMKLQPIVRP